MLESKPSYSTAYWDEKRNTIESKKGKWLGGEDVIFSGYSLKKDLLGKVSYMQVVILNATGRLVSKNLADWFEGNLIGMSYPDSRIWCNQVGVFAGQTKTSAIAGTVAGILCADSRAFGSQTNITGMQFIRKALSLSKQGQSLEAIVSSLANFKGTKPTIVGYARPIAKQDERIEPHENMRKRLGFKKGEHLQLAMKIGDYLEEKHSLGINICGYVSAFLCDQKFTPDEVYKIKAVSVSSGVTAAYSEGKEDTIYSFLPQKCTDVIYNGPKKRKVIE